MVNMDDDFEKMLSAALGKTQHDTIDRAVADDAEPLEEVPEGHKSGYVAVIGRPNVGKSTLMNQILGEKVAIVSPKPQTTRIRQLGILTDHDKQIVFMDTPGIHKSKDSLGEFMVEVAKAALEDADVVLFLTDVSEPVTSIDRQIAEQVREVSDQDKIIHVVNKVDAVKDPEKFKTLFETHRALLPEVDYVATVATEITARLSEGPRFFPRDQVSDIPLRDITAEMIREQVLKHTEQEVPYSIAVEINEFKQRKAGLIYISATIYTEKDGQKGIIIGKGGRMLKQISSAARHEIEPFLNSQIFLEIRVKVLPNWRSNPDMLKRFGYRL
jgi:GTP-binding protein Era